MKPNPRCIITCFCCEKTMTSIPRYNLSFARASLFLIQQKLRSDTRVLVNGGQHTTVFIWLAAKNFRR